MRETVSTPRRFVELASDGQAKWVKVKKVSEDRTKFILRTTRYLYTIVVKEKFVKLVTDSLPPSLEVIHLDKGTRNE
jgi:large subunit ribosomal protein L38e